MSGKRKNFLANGTFLARRLPYSLQCSHRSGRFPTLLCALMVAGAASRSPRREPRGLNLQIDFGVAGL